MWRFINNRQTIIYLIEKRDILKKKSSRNLVLHVWTLSPLLVGRVLPCRESFFVCFVGSSTCDICKLIFHNLRITQVAPCYETLINFLFFFLSPFKLILRCLLYGHFLVHFLVISNLQTSSEFQACTILTCLKWRRRRRYKSWEAEDWSFQRDWVSR